MFNRKEAKDHGEGGQFVGAPITGRLLLVDDVLTAVREGAELLNEQVVGKLNDQQREIATMILTRLVLKPIYPEYTDWADFFVYLWPFLYGFIFMADQQFLDIVKNRMWAVSSSSSRFGTSMSMRTSRLRLIE